MKIRHAVAALVLAAASSAQADSEALAASLFDKTIAVQMKPVIERMLATLAGQGQLPPRAVEIYRSNMLGMFGSPRYRQAYVDAYGQLFTEQELAMLNDLADHPGFALYMARIEKLQQMTYPVFVTLLQETRPEIHRQLDAAGLGAYK